jgi:phosphoinositide-3-kinase regulatory subunit 4
LPEHESGVDQARLGDENRLAADSATEDRLRPNASAISLLNRRDASKSFPATGTSSEVAQGTLQGPFAPTAPATDQNEDAATSPQWRVAHSYTGNDPSVLKMLAALTIENHPSDVFDFGPFVDPTSRRKTRNITEQSPPLPSRPSGTLVAIFAEHVGPVSRVLPCSDHVFFITAGDDGSVRVWDTARLERNIAHRSRQVWRLAQGTRVSAICFVENTRCFVVAGSDGSMQVVKVDVLVDAAGGSKTARYGKLGLVRSWRLEEEESAVWMEHQRVEGQSLLIAATNKSRIIAVDLRTSKTLWVLRNPVRHGALTCFVVDRNRNFIVVGTSHGVLDVWDLRFKVRVKAWGVPRASSLRRLRLHPFKGRGKWVVVAGGGAAAEVSVWDIEKSVCKEVYRAATGASGRAIRESWEPLEVDDDRPERTLDRFAKLDGGGALDLSSTAHGGIFGLAVGTSGTDDGRDARRGWMLTGGDDRRVRWWDLAEVEGSGVVSGGDADRAPLYAQSQATSGTMVYEEGAAPARHDEGSKTSRSTIISKEQHALLKSHLDTVTDVALLESPNWMTLSADRSGCVYVFQ